MMGKVKKVTSNHLFLPLFALALLLVFNAFATPGFFAIEFQNGQFYGRIIDILNRASILVILSMGMTFVIATGGIDISQGSVIAISGAICGLAFGITSFMQCFGMGAFGTMLFSINPLGTAVVCIVPRLLEGWITGLIFKAVRGKMKNGAYLVASLACPLLNTLFFMSTLVLIFYHTDYIQGFVTSLGVSNPFTFVVAFVGVQGLIEAIVCFILAGAISRALSAALHRI